jgi:octaprenyl-diphosphate synthase
MSQASVVRVAERAAVNELFRPVALDLQVVERRLQAELRSREPFVDELARHSFRMGGKRLRPALLLLSARAAGEIGEAHHTLGAVVEMIHTATLVHDDVLDEADVRRHMDTVNARWNNQTSVLLGDYLFSHAFYLASTIGSTFACQEIGRTTNVVCEGELLQTSRAGDFWLSQEDYFRIIDGKTASLCGCCCLLGAHYAQGSEDVVRKLETFGREVGLAFQIADDLLDFEGDEPTAGKSLGADLANKKMTLPLIFLRDQLASEEQQRLERYFSRGSSEDLTTLVRWLSAEGAFERARQTACAHAEAAIHALRDLPEGAAIAALKGVARFTVSRRL